MKIGIDAGHGHNTPGRRTNDGLMREWDFNSNVATKVIDKLISRLSGVGVEVVRTDDPTGNTDIQLNTRVKKFNNAGVDLVVSIHANGGGGTGIETFVYKKTLKGSNRLADLVQSKMVTKTGMTNRGVKEGDFAIIRDTKMDAVLVECGFMDNDNDAVKLKDDNYRNLCADAIVEAILEFKGLTPKPTPTPTPTPVKDTTIRVGDTVVVNGIGRGNSAGSGAYTPNYINRTMKVLDIVPGRAYPYALSANLSAKPNINGSNPMRNGITAWFKGISIRK